MLKPDPMKLTPEQLDRLEAYNQTKKQIQTLEDIADISQEILGVFDDYQKLNKENTKNIGSLLADAREQLVALNNKESEDYSTPIVKALEKLEKAFSKLEVKVPDITVDAPQVNVNPPSVDLSGIEIIVKKELPKAFENAISKIPSVHIPETDNSELLAAWEGISEQLVSLENATRMKPIPGTIKVTNPDGTSIGSLSGSTYYESYTDTTTDTNLVYLGKATPGSAVGDAAWQIKRYNKTTGQMSFADDVTTFTKQWSARTGYTY